MCIMNGKHTIDTRPASAQLDDLHVYVIPTELWRENLRSAANEVISDSISLGFLRIAPQTQLGELRHEIPAQLGDDYLPRDYAFLKSVGRCLTQVKARQERELKVKHFLPPYAYSPEIFLLDSHADALRDSPSTISNPSLLGTATLRGTRSQPEYYNKQPEYPLSNRISHSRADETSRVDTRHQSQSVINGSKGYNSPAPLKKSTYPTYEQPFSHDISALTNAHRNNITSDDQSGSTTYRKEDNNSSGYKTSSSREAGIHTRETDSDLDIDSGSSGEQTVGKIAEGPPTGPSVSHGNQGDNHGNYRSRNTRESPPNHRLSGEDATPRNPGQSIDYDNPQLPGNATEREIMSATPTSTSQLSKQDHRFSEGRGEEPVDDNENTSDKNRIESIEEEMPKLQLDVDEVGDLEPYRKSIEDSRHEADSEHDLDAASPHPQGNGLLSQLREARRERLAAEKRREELVKKARALQAKTNNRRNQAREEWKKKYYEEKKQTPALESECQKVRAELEALHKKYLAALASQTGGKSKENQHVEAARLQHQVDQLQRRADAAKMKLTAEMKLRNQAETELRALRAELTQKKMNLSLTRAQKMNAMPNSVGNSTSGTPGKFSSSPIKANVGSVTAS